MILVNVIWSKTAAIFLTLAGMHLRVWFRSSPALTSLLSLLRALIAGSFILVLDTGTAQVAPASSA